DDAALVDGCTQAGVLWRVMLPLVRPGMVTAALFGAIFIWNEFLVALYVIDSRDYQTISLGAATLVSAQRPIDWNIAAAVGVVTVIPILIFSLLVQRYIVRGLTAGAVKCATQRGDSRSWWRRGSAGPRARQSGPTAAWCSSRAIAAS